MASADAAECWPWQGFCEASGYGVFNIGRQHCRASVVAIFLATGELPEVGEVVMHSCDNPPCVNASHLSIGTHADNHADRNRKGRHAFGERMGSAKLTAAEVIEAKGLREEGATFVVLGARYGVDRKAIERAVKGETWKHV